MVMERKPLFEQLPSEDQAELLLGYERVQQKGSVPWMQEIGEIFFHKTPPFALAWLFFSLLICFLLLFHIEGAAVSVWLLPLIVLGYAYFLYDAPKKARESLFPSEEYVLTTYVKSAENNARGQRESLLLGWHRYLVQEWAHELPSDKPQVFQQQLDKGLFAFNVARLKWMLQGKGDEVILAGFAASHSQLRLGCYFFWNLGFAWIINRKERSTSVAAPSNLTC
jgi:hypothetical protein